VDNPAFNPQAMLVDGPKGSGQPKTQAAK